MVGLWRILAEEMDGNRVRLTRQGQRRTWRCGRHLVRCREHHYELPQRECFFGTFFALASRSLISRSDPEQIEALADRRSPPALGTAV